MYVRQVPDRGGKKIYCYTHVASPGDIFIGVPVPGNQNVCILICLPAPGGGACMRCHMMPKYSAEQHIT